MGITHVDLKRDGIPLDAPRVYQVTDISPPPAVVCTPDD
jgi:hypothetical protein